MISPSDMRIIQIDITNACIHRCSNCTRFCGHHKKPFFMDFETFKRAVDSLDGYVGTVGMMGGEPTLNPDFEKMARYLAEKRGGNDTGSLIRPQAHFMDEIHDTEMEHTFMEPCSFGGERRTVDGPGLWSAIGERYKKYYETIQDTMRYQALNDHSNVMYHQPGLISRKDLRISDADWIPIRDNCWIQNKWSACITPKGAFFCEIAGALDMLFDGPGGWEIEPGWWKKRPEDFKDQLHWCEICGLALNTFMRNANEEMDDVSPTLYKKLQDIDSPGLKSGRVNLLKIDNGEIAEESKAPIEKRGGDMPYTESYSARYNEEKTNLFFKNIKILHIESGNKEGLGKLLYDNLYGEDYNTYLLLLMGVVKDIGASEALKGLVTNPGTLLYKKYDRDTKDGFFDAAEGSEVMLINPIAHSIKTAGWDRLLRVRTLKEVADFWQKKKVISFEPGMERRVPAVQIIPGKKYAVFGAGRIAEKALDTIRSRGSEVIAFADTDENLQGREILGFKVMTPDELRQKLEKIDVVMIAKGPYYRETKEKLLSWGLQPDRMAWI